jgi:tRNA-dihydrouridine synthase B
MSTPYTNATSDPLPLTIGSFQLSSPVILAPMAGVADAPFREVCRQFGAGLSTSEMLTSDIGLWHQPKSQWRLRWAPNETPVSIQIAGTDPALMAQAAQACQELGAQIIDINMGCPAKKVCKKSAGSALMAQEELAYRIIREVVSAVDCPVMVKTRTGTNLGSLNAVQIAQLAESAGAKAIAIHGRTRACKFQGYAEHATVKAVKSAISVPVFANGDIKTAKEAKCILDETAVDGIMIGRGALGRPWIFREIHEYLTQGRITFEPSFAEKLTVINQHLRKIHEFYGVEVGVRLARKHMSWYLQYLPNGKELSKQFVLLKTCDEQLRLLDHSFENLAMERC